MRHVLIALLGFLVTRIACGAELPGLAKDARSIVGPDQGVYVEAADGRVLLAQAASKPVHPASVSKVPTTLALLRKLGPEHRFVTTFGARGSVVDGSLRGDLWVHGGGNPSLVDEDALLIANRLAEQGIHQVMGALRLQGSLTFDWQSDDDGSRLLQALSGKVSAAALEAVRAVQLESHPIAFVMPPQLQRFGELSTERVLVVHRSQPLLALTKALNDYSNNIFKPLADEAGGAAAVESLARSVVPASMRDEIILGDGAGTDPRNRLSPRVTVSLLRELEKELHRTGHALFDILPVAGIDDGTLRHRFDADGEAGRVVGKTGTYGDYGACALIGAISTSDLGTVYFAILNHGVRVPEARRRQDGFVRALLKRLHSQPWPYERDMRPAFARAEVLKGG